MATSIAWATKVITVNQADLSFVSGTFYTMDTDQFRKDLNALQAGEEGMWADTTHLHNTEVTVAGTTFARTVEIINGYTVQFLPDSQWTVQLLGSNNNIFDVGGGILVQNQVQVIPTNSAGLIVVSTGSGLSAAQDTKLTQIHGEVRDIEGGEHHSWLMRIMMSALSGLLSGAAGTNVKTRDMADTKDRIDATVDADGNRTSVTLDGD